MFSLLLLLWTVCSFVVDINHINHINHINQSVFYFMSVYRVIFDQKTIEK